MMQTFALPNQFMTKALLGTAFLFTLLVASFGAVQMPWLTTGAVVGLMVLTLALAAPLALVALMLIIGPIDLSPLTGGFKALFPELGGLDMNGIRLVGATAGFTAFIMFEPRARAAAWSFAGRFWLVFLAFAMCTLALSLDKLEGMRLLLKLAYPFLTFLIVIGLADTRERLNTLTRYLLLAAAVLTIVVNPILVANGGYRIDFEGALRVEGLGMGDNPYAFYCTAMLMLAFARFMIRMQVRYAAFSGVLLMWIALTQTRIAALAALMGLSLIGMFAAWTSGNRRLFAGAIITAIVAAAVLVPNALERSLGFVPTPGQLFALLSDPVALYNSMNWQGRQVIWAILWGGFMASPVWGQGLGSSAAILLENFGVNGIRVAHNDYLRLAVDTGIIGLGMFLVAMGTWLLTALRLSRHEDPGVREYAFAAVAILVAWAVVAFTDNAIDYYNNFAQYLGFALAGAVIAAAQPSVERSAP